MIRTIVILIIVLLSSMAHAQDPIKTDGDNYRVILENDRVRVLEHRDKPGEKTRQHQHPAFVLYAVSAFKRMITLPDGKVIMREFKAGDMLYSDAQTHVGENIGQTDTHVIMVELKQNAEDSEYQE